MPYVWCLDRLDREDVRLLPLRCVNTSVAGGREVHDGNGGPDVVVVVRERSMQFQKNSYAHARSI